MLSSAGFIVFYLLFPIALVATMLVPSWRSQHVRVKASKPARGHGSGQARVADTASPPFPLQGLASGTDEGPSDLVVPAPLLERLKDDPANGFADLLGWLYVIRRAHSNDPEIPYHVDALHVILWGLQSDTSSFLLTAEVSGQVADFLKAWLDALNHRDRPGLDRQLGNIKTLAVPHAALVPTLPDEKVSAEKADQAILDELALMADLSVQPGAEGDFERRQLRLLRLRAWRYCSPQLRVTLNYLARRLANPGGNLEYNIQRGQAGLRGDRFRVATLVYDVCRAVQEGNYARVSDLVRQDMEASRGTDSV